MKDFITTFNTITNYNIWKSSDRYVQPNASYISNDNIVVTLPPPDYSKDYLTFEAIENGTFTLEIGSNIGTSLLTSISYSIDNGQTWITTNNEDNNTVTITTPTINQGDTVLWKGIGTSMSTATKDTAAASRPAACSRFSSTGNFNVSGNIMSLLYGDNFANQISFESGSSSNFALLFYCTNMDTIAKIVSAENLILPTANSNYAYFRTFQNNDIINPPKLLFSTLGQYSCGQMFYNCTSLTTAPEVLPATTLANYCYQYMFQGCTSLTTAPELPATTLANFCYNSMFFGCTSLTTAPELPATTLADHCYTSMFYSCTNLTTAPELHATTLASYCYNTMFSGCTSLTNAPELPATTLASYCYRCMFQNCTSLNYIKCLATNISASNCLTDWVSNVSSTGTFIKDDSMSSWPSGTSGIPAGWTVQTASV